MADSQGQNYYWQSDNQNTTGENVGSVLDDLCNIVVITEIQDNQNTVTFVPGLNGEKGHFRLGVGSKPINALANELIVGDGNDWATGNAAKVKMSKKTIADFGSNSAKFETDQVNCFSFQSSMANVEPTTFIIDKGAQILMGKTVVHDYEEGVWTAPTFWDEEIPYSRLILDGAAQIMMQPKDDMQMPIIQMDGGAIMRFNYSKEHPYYDCFKGGSENIVKDIRRYEDPFGIIKNNQYISSGIPIFSMHDSPTFQMLDNAVFQAKNGSQTVVQGNARVHISGGQWSDHYHVKSNINFTVELVRTTSYTDTGTITFDINDVMFTKEFYEILYHKDFFSNMYDLVRSVYEKYNGQPGVTITFDNLTEQEFLVSSNFRSVYVKTKSVTGIEDFDKITEIDIGPNTIIRTQCDTEDSNKGAFISVEPTQIRVGIGNFDNADNSMARFIRCPNYHDAFTHVGYIVSAKNYDFPINKNFLSLGNDASIPTLVQDLTNNVPDPYFEITGGSALKIDQNSMVLRCADMSCGLIDDIDIFEGSYLANILSASANSRVTICKNFNKADAVENTHISGKYSKDINLYGNTSIRIGPGSEGQGQQDPVLLGIDLTGVHTDIVGHWKNFQAILSGNDSFINWDGNNHYESWSGTQIFRASNPTRQTIKSKYYPLFTGETGAELDTKTLEIWEDLSSYTNQQIADEFGNYLTLTKPEDVWNRIYNNPELNVNGITKTFINNNYVQSVDIQTNTTNVWISAASVYVYSDTDYSTYTAAMANATIKELFGKALNIKGSWSFNRNPSYSHEWDDTVGKYKLWFSNVYISLRTGMSLLYFSTGTTTPNDFDLPANTAYSDMTAEQKALMAKVMNLRDNKVYHNGVLAAWSTAGSYNNSSYLKTAADTNYSVELVSPIYEVTAQSSIPWHQTAHMGKDWRGPIQTVDRIGQNPAPWEKGPIVQAYGPVNFTMREKWIADADHTKTFDLTSSATYDVSNQAQAIADFQANTTDYAAFEAYLTQEDYTLWDILSIATADGGYTITFSICEAGWKPHIDSYPDNPVVEITDGSELRLYGGVKIKGETKYNKTTFTFSGTQSEGEVSFTLDELRSLKALIGSVRTSVVNDASEATEPGIIYFIDEGGNA